MPTICFYSAALIFAYFSRLFSLIYLHLQEFSYVDSKLCAGT